jgi:hypothetical protein
MLCRDPLEELLTQIGDDRPPALQERAKARTRRELLRAAGAALPAAAAIALVGNAHGFSREEMPAELAKVYRGRCAADPVHAATLDAAFARLDALGITYDRAELAATLRCPICGCTIISGPEARENRPSY